MIKGIDVSHWNGKIDWKKVKKSGVEFSILKATEALNYVDPTLEENTKEARDNGVLLGFYHFARGNDPHKEAEFFLSKLPKLQEGEFLVLDYEISIVNEADWCRRFLDRVFDKTGIRPIIYMSEFRLRSTNWQQVIDGNFGLWVAKYKSNDVFYNYDQQPEPITGQWPFKVMWQFSSKGRVDGISGNVDMNVAYVKDIDTLKKYGQVNELEDPEIDEGLYYQRSVRYKGKKIGKTNTSMQDFGCVIMCFAYIMRKDPLYINELFLKKGVYFNGDLVVFSKACEVLGLKDYEKNRDINRMPTQEETIKEVYLGKSPHFVVRFSKDGKRWIFDPWLGKTERINYYTFKSYRIFTIIRYSLVKYSCR